MTIEYAILGILSCSPQTGYDIKKIMQDSPFMYWSGNNNQIYKALVTLHGDGLVTGETLHRDGAPSKKVFFITDAGLAALRGWALAVPEPPEAKNAFLVQLAWSWQLTGAQVDDLLAQYERGVQDQLLIAQSKRDAGAFLPDRTPREATIWRLIHDNVVEGYRRELEWTGRVREAIGPLEPEEAPPIGQTTETEETGMRHTIMEKNDITYIYLGPEGEPIRTERDGLDLISLCAQHGTNRLLIHSDRLPDEFFRLRTGLAGAILQKFAQYSIKAAVALDSARVRGKFEDFLLESNRGTLFNAYDSLTAAEAWLVRG